MNFRITATREYLSLKWKRFLCCWLGHKLTSLHEKGVQPKPEQFSYEGFLAYSTVWCERCKEILPHDLITLMLAMAVRVLAKERKPNETDRGNIGPLKLH